MCVGEVGSKAARCEGRGNALGGEVGDAEWRCWDVMWWVGDEVR